MALPLQADLYVQASFEAAFDPSRGPADVTIRIPRGNLLNPEAIRHLARCRDQVIAQMQGKVRHHE